MASRWPLSLPRGTHPCRRLSLRHRRIPQHRWCRGAGARGCAACAARGVERNRSALLARFDDNRDGAIDVDEWERARRVAEQEVATELALRSAEPEVALLSR